MFSPVIRLCLMNHVSTQQHLPQMDLSRSASVWFLGKNQSIIRGKGYFFYPKAFTQNYLSQNYYNFLDGLLELTKKGMFYLYFVIVIHRL
jgi:hypothetical protein